MKSVAAMQLLKKHTHFFLLCSSAIRRASQELDDAFLHTPSEKKLNLLPEQEAKQEEAKKVVVLHAFAAKANPLKAILAVAQRAGLGCETASIGEFEQALKVFPPCRIVFDSPVKTTDELRRAVYLPCFLNVDNFQELDRVAQMNTERPIVATIGVRINPQLGAGAIGQLSTALETSKFGIGLKDHRTELVAAFHEHAFLKMLHVHTGSQGIGLTMMTAGVKAIVSLALEIGVDKVRFIDIGGGLPVNFSSDEVVPTFQTYADGLKKEVPELFDAKNNFGLITEFGRAIVAKAGVLISRVEYTKVNGGRRIIQQHIGADLCLRTVWQPENWKLRVDVYDALGFIKNDSLGETDVAGPCCLGGDLVAVKQMLPAAVPMEDCVVVKDVGGYYHSSYSFYNLRMAPPVYLFDEETQELMCINSGQSLESCLSFMGDS